MVKEIIKQVDMVKPLVEGKKNIKIVIDGVEKEAAYRIFKSGKKGYGLYGVIKIDGYPHRISLNLIEFS